MEAKKQLIIGLPETGKTTFLAALWHVVESEEVPGSLVVSEVHGVRDHLNKIRQEWLNCQELQRTKIPAEKIVSFRLRDPKTKREVELFLPDLSGETFKSQWESRLWTKEFDKLASECSEALLFVHPRTIAEPVRINSTLDAMAAVLGEPNEAAGGPADAIPAASSDGSRTGPTNPCPLVAEPSAAHSAPVEPWSPAHSPTQVRLVEILQFLLGRPFLDRSLPLAVVLSAWDLIGTKHTPSEWLEKRLPLLDQFLRANGEAVPSTVFGISAQGGELSSAKDLQQHIKASDRIIVTKPDQTTTHDITTPIKWLLRR